MTQDEIERRLLLKECAGLIDHNDHVRTLGIAYVNSELATQTAQALLNLMLHKGIIGQHEIQAALADAYRTRREQLDDGGLITPRMNGS